MAAFDKTEINYVEIEDSALIKCVKNRFNPENIFSRTDLEEWAEQNGYIKEAENE